MRYFTVGLFLLLCFAVFSGCENVRHKIGISTKPFATDGKFEDSTKMNYTIIFGKVRPKEDDD
jgi:hypothetical protein